MAQLVAVFLVVIALVGVALGAIVIKSLIDGYVLSILWGWFMVPIFGLPSLSVAGAIGLALIVNYLTHQTPPDCEEKKRNGREVTVRWGAILILHPLMALILGAIVRSFM